MIYSNILLCETPKAWIKTALENLSTLLIDHAHCEKKAAATALSLMHRYVEKPDLLDMMSRLAREELLHFEKVQQFLRKGNIKFYHLPGSRYAKSLRKFIRNHEPERLIDTLIVGAFIEARSCERFASLVPHLEEPLAGFYASLLKSEARHFSDYLELAEKYSDEDIKERVDLIAETERELIESKDELFSFHSGVIA